MVWAFNKAHTKTIKMIRVNFFITISVLVCVLQYNKFLIRMKKENGNVTQILRSTPKNGKASVYQYMNYDKASGGGLPAVLFL